ncbi:MAG: hypothetical protein SP1CHLAM9_05000 [Chlamydiia bacterium]|nr:hypothetical protein [Chlamydiia bacterium]
MSNIKSIVFGLALLVPGFNSITAYEVKKETVREFSSWTEVQTEAGCCKASFPRKPDHIQQDMKMRGTEEKLRYDVYVADHQKKEVFMVLIAKYPGEVKREDGKQNLEHFLNTLVSQNANNKLLFADIVEVDGNIAMDFFIRTDSVYFKGRAIQANNSLYLLAMECPISCYQEHHFNYFIESFTLRKP